MFLLSPIRFLYASAHSMNGRVIMRDWGLLGLAGTSSSIHTFNLQSERSRDAVRHRQPRLIKKASQRQQIS